MTLSFERVMSWLSARPRQASKVIEGKNGKLFLDNDSNRVMRQITGRMRASKRDIAALRAAHAKRRNLCAAMGIEYRHVICPNKESVETHDLPDAFGYERYGPTYLAQYLRAGALDRTFYDRDTLKAVQGAYFRTDSHWSEIGAVAYLTAVLRREGDQRALKRLDELQMTPVPIKRQGDLGLKLGWPPEDAQGLDIADPSSSLLFESTPGEGYMRFRRCVEPVNDGMKALVLNDSFTEFLFRFVCELYAETLFLHTPDLDLRFLQRYKPTVVWFFQAERFLPRLPRNDVDYIAMLRRREQRRHLTDHGALFMETTWPERDA